MRAQPAAARGLRAVLYLRQSTTREESISLELQETAGRNYAAQQGYTVVAVESDPGISGRTWNRPAVRKVMSLIEDGNADVIVLWKWSRLSRARLDWAVAVDRVETAGGRIESATEPLDTTTSAGRLARGMMAEFAAFESERIGDGWKESQQRRRLRGLPPNGGDRFGYTREGDTYTPDPSTAELLASLYQRHVDGEGLTRLVRWLNENGYRTVTGVMWAPDKLRSLLDSGFAAGLIIQGRGVDARFYPGAHPPIISLELWEAFVQRRRAAPRPPGIVEPKYFLTGLVKCGDCGGPMRSMNRNGKQDGYGCGNYLRTRMGRFVTARRTAAEEYVFEQLKGLAHDIDAFARLEVQAAERKVTAVNDAAAVEARIAAIDEQMGTITMGWSTGKVPDVAYESAMKRLQSQRDSYAARARVVRSTSSAELSGRRVVTDLVGNWGDYTVFEKRDLLAAVIESVRVIPPAVKKQGGAGSVRFEIDWAFPT